MQKKALYEQMIVFHAVQVVQGSYRDTLPYQTRGCSQPALFSF